MNYSEMENGPTTCNLQSARVVGEAWRDVLCHRFPDTSIDWLDQAGPGWVGTGVFSEALLMEISCEAPVRVVSNRSAVTGDNTFELVQLRRGKCRCRHAGHDVVWEARDLMLFDSTQGFELTHPPGYQFLIWKLPRATVAPMLAAPEDSVGRRIPGGAGMGALLGNFLDSLTRQSAQLDAAAKHLLVMQLGSLVGLSLGASQEAREGSRVTRRAVRRQQILNYIEMHLRDPRLSAQQAAQDLQISLRWLHALLAECGQSFGARVRHRRIEECYRIVADPNQNHRTVAEIAFEYGFGNLSSFNRHFRARYDVAPRDVRRLTVEDKRD